MGQKEIEKDILKVLPSGRTLYPFQIETIATTLSFLHDTSSHSAYIANEMGLGKSITSLVTGLVLNAQRILIICPAVVRLVWQEEIKIWDMYASTCVISSARDVKDSYNAKYVICSYTLVSKKEVLDTLLLQDFTLLISDENHKCKSVKAKCTTAVMGHIWNKAKYKLLLSGTPMTSGVTDLYVPFSKILPEQFPSWHKFVNTYSKSRAVPWGNGIEYYGLKNAESLSKIIRSNFYIRYKKQDVLKDLPAKIFQKIPLSKDYSVKDLTENKAKELFEEMQKALTLLADNKSFKMPSCLAEYRSLQGIAKVPAVVEFAIDLLEQDIPIVIFGWHKNVIKLLETKLNKYNPVVIMGETPEQNRKKAIDNFQNKQTTNLFIGNIASAGIGITLTRASHVLMAEIDWSPANNDQAISRCHRITSKSQVIVYTFIVEDSFDEHVERVVMEKTKNFNQVCDDCN